MKVKDVIEMLGELDKDIEILAVHIGDGQIEVFTKDEDFIYVE